MSARALLVILLLAGCAAPEGTSRTATGGCLFWSADCTKLEDAPPPPPLGLQIAEARGTEIGTLSATLPVRDELPAEDLGRVRAPHEPRQRDTAGEASFDSRFAGSQTGTPAETVYPLPANCTSPPSSLLRNSPAGRFAPGRNSAAATAYASAYNRCRQPGTWPRP